MLYRNGKQLQYITAVGSLSNKEVGKKFDSKWLISNVHHTVEGKIMKIDYFDKQA